MNTQGRRRTVTVISMACNTQALHSLCHWPHNFTASMDPPLLEEMSSTLFVIQVPHHSQQACIEGYCCMCGPFGYSALSFSDYWVLSNALSFLTILYSSAALNLFSY